MQISVIDTTLFNKAVANSRAASASAASATGTDTSTVSAMNTDDFTERVDEKSVEGKSVDDNSIALSALKEDPIVGRYAKMVRICCHLYGFEHYLLIVYECVCDSKNCGLFIYFFYFFISVYIYCVI